MARPPDPTGPPPPRSGPADPTTGWAPFPVQDWSAYRSTEAWREYESSWSYLGSNLVLDPVEPGPGPKSGIIPVLVLGLVCVVLASGLVLADRAFARGGEPLARWLPANGTAASVALTGPALARGGTRPATVENAIGPWPEVAQSLTIELGETMLDRSSGTTGELWRQTTTPADPNLPQLASVYSLHDGIRLELDVGDRLAAKAYRPGLPVLPVDVAAGQQWTASGTWAAWFDQPARPYTAQLRADAAGDCLVVAANVATEVNEPTGQPGGTVTEAMTFRFCPGQGVVERTRDRDVGFAPAAAVTPPEYGATGTPTGRVPPSGTPVVARVTVPTSQGADLLGGTPRAVPPFAVSVDQIVQVNQSLQDLLVFRVTGTGTTLGLTLQRRLHPGGLVLTATSVQGTILATTSSRTLTAWTPTGVRRWSADTTEVIAQRPIAIDPATVLTVTVTGTITAWDVPTGTVRWTTEAASGVGVGAAVGSGVVVVADAEGGVVGYDLATGAVRWSISGDPAERLVVLSDRAVVVSGGLAYGYDLADGRLRWTNRAGGTTWMIESDGTDGLLLTGPRSVIDLTVSDGVRRWRTSETCEDTTVSPSWTICWTATRGLVLSRSTGTVTGSVAVPDARGSVRPLLLQGRLWVFDSVAWAAWAWPVA